MLSPCNDSKRSKSVVSSVESSFFGLLALPVSLFSSRVRSATSFVSGSVLEVFFADLVCLEVSDLMVGGSCRWSPARTSFGALHASAGIQHCASSA